MGGGRGLGEATAYALAKAGASDIILAARTTTELDTVAANLGKMSSNINVSTVRCDVTSEPDVLALTDLLKTKHSSHLDVLVNNAGFLRCRLAAHHCRECSSVRLKESV